eukprot:gnl/TRDRNA2_/TRDRNA2_171212_c0_seq4.p1 gnl/TRDRNA2_/TRDRNA2_171212_c0~~gnl/TRDRNA2_/TRDRNA2_171212_c0_seq4.p1  ORF type:complete len:635 (+),score=111.61 gnl/TRDRNA2_/TRDRNA2_171212_c0_seq4:81-1985(+)
MAFSGMIPCSPTSCPSGRVPEEESVLWWALVQPAVEQSVRNAVGQALQQELRGSMQVQKEFLQYELGLHRKILESLLLLRADGSTSCTDIRPENIWTMLPVQEEHLSLAISGELHDHPQEWEAPEKATGSQDRVTSREGENQAPPQACGSEDRGNDNGQQEDVHGCADDHKHSGHVAFKDRGNSMRRSKTNADVTYEIWKEDVTHGQDVSPLHLRTLYVLDWWVNLEEPTRTGWLAAIVSSGRFESLTILVIVLNAFFMAYVANYDISHINHEPTEFITSAERFFTIFFLVELILKLCVHRRYFFVNENMKWNIFDFFLVGLAVYDQLVTLIAHSGGGPNMTFMRTLRMLKMAKMLRMARVLKAFKDLRMMIVCIAGSLMSLFWSFVMLALILYMFALFFVQGFTGLLTTELLESTVTDDIGVAFGSVESAMLSLFKCVTGGDDWGAYHTLIEMAGPIYSVGFVFFVGFFNFAVFNILTGMFVEQAMKCAEPDSEELIFEQRKEEIAQKGTITELCREIDADGSGTINLEEFGAYMQTAKGRHLLKLQGLDVDDAETFFHLLTHASQCPEVEIGLFTDCAMKMRGLAKAMDLQVLFYQVKMLERKQEALGNDVTRQLQSLQSTLDKKYGRQVSR